MKASRKQLARAIVQIIEERPDSEAVAEAIAAYLIDERQTRELDSILRDVEQRRYDKDGILEVTAQAARPLSEENKAAIKALFDAREVIIHEEQDKKLIGGVRVRALEKSADFSVQARLRQLRRSV